MVRIQLLGEEGRLFPAYSRIMALTVALLFLFVEIFFLFLGIEGATENEEFNLESIFIYS